MNEERGFSSKTHLYDLFLQHAFPPPPLINFQHFSCEKLRMFLLWTSMLVHALFQPICNFTDRLRAKHRGNQREEKWDTGQRKISFKTFSKTRFISLLSGGPSLVDGPLDKWGLPGNPHKSVLPEHNLQGN